MMTVCICTFNLITTKASELSLNAPCKLLPRLWTWAIIIYRMVVLSSMLNSLCAWPMGFQFSWWSCSSLRGSCFNLRQLSQIHGSYGSITTVEMSGSMLYSLYNILNIFSLSGVLDISARNQPPAHCTGLTSVVIVYPHIEASYFTHGIRYVTAEDPCCGTRGAVEK